MFLWSFIKHRCLICRSSNLHKSTSRMPGYTARPFSSPIYLLLEFHFVLIFSISIRKERYFTLEPVSDSRLDEENKAITRHEYNQYHNALRKQHPECPASAKSTWQSTNTMPVQFCSCSLPQRYPFKIYRG